MGQGAKYSLEKFFLSGLSRVVRRALPAADFLENMGQAFGRPMTMDDLEIWGPLVVVRAIAIY